MLDERIFHQELSLAEKNLLVPWILLQLELHEEVPGASVDLRRTIIIPVGVPRYLGQLR